MSDEELLATSDLVVIGQWVGQTSISVSGESTPIEVGAVAVHEVLKGPAGLTLALVQTNAPSALRSSSDIARRRGDTGLWLLKSRPGGGTGIYLADHPQRFVPVGGEAARIEALRRLLRR